MALSYALSLVFKVVEAVSVLCRLPLNNALTFIEHK